jgi:hypothetical protein
MSDIGILNSPLGIAFILMLFGAPGIPIGAIAGALLWRTIASTARASAP